MIPTPRALWLLALGTLLVTVSFVFPPGLALVIAFDAAVLALMVVDFVRAPRLEHFHVTRQVEPVLSSGVMNVVHLRVEVRPFGNQARYRVLLRDVVPPGPEVRDNGWAFELQYEAARSYRLLPLTRGDLVFSTVVMRAEGPWGLCQRQLRFEVPSACRVFPDLTALTRDALFLAKLNQDNARPVARIKAEGREFESLREYRHGDDRRTIDWKATARRNRPLVRVHQPERNQTVLLLLDCGRHMAGEVHQRRKLDFAVDAVLRLAKVSLDRGDLVGVMAFGSTVQSWLPPRKGPEQIKQIANTLYRIEASLEESDYGAAIDQALIRTTRRSLVVVLTDLLDAESSKTLMHRMLRLVPRHLPLIATLVDDDLERAATQPPNSVHDAYARRAARQLREEVRGTMTRLRNSGAHVVSAPAPTFGAAAVNAYFGIKDRGLL